MSEKVKRRAHHKVISRWKYEHEDGAKLDIPIIMVERHEDGYGVFSKTIDDHFLIEVPQYGVSVREKEIEKLKREAKKILDEKVSTDWQEWLLVSVNGQDTNELGDYHHGNSNGDIVGDLGRKRWLRETSLTLDVQRWLLGTTTDGRKVSKCLAPRHYASVREGWPETGANQTTHFGRPKDMQALIRDTPENREALGRAAEALNKIHDMLSKLLSPDQLERTIAAVIAGKSPLALGSGLAPDTPIP